MSNDLSNFFQKVNKILSISGVNREEGEEIKEKLAQAAQANFLHQLMGAVSQFSQEDADSFLQELNALKGVDFLNEESLSAGDVKLHLQKIKELVSTVDFNFKKELESSEKIVLNDLVKSLSEDLSVEQLEKLKAVFLTRDNSEKWKNIG